MKLYGLYAILIVALKHDLCYGNDATTVSKTFKTGKLEIQTDNHKLLFNIKKKDGVEMKSVIYTKTSKILNEESLKIEQDCELLTTCVLFGNVTFTKVKTDPESETIQITRVIEDSNAQLIDCFELADNTEWFGGPETKNQYWPIQHMQFEDEPYVPSHRINMAIAERYWLSSKGIYVYVDETVPLFLNQNNYKDKHLCLVAKSKSPYRKTNNITLQYEIGVFSDPKKAHEHVIAKHFGKPTGHPNERMVTHPVWSTWARYKVNVNESAVRKLADEILENGFNNSQIEIDDNWETCYGSAKFNTAKFPDVERLVADLNEKGFRLTLWIHPFINRKCNDGEGYDYASKNHYFVKNTNGRERTTWWQSSFIGAAVVDFTNAKAVDWWVGRLKKLKELGFESFKFDAGEGTYLPKISVLTGPPELQPGIFTVNYTTNVAKHFGDSIEVRTGWRTQNLPVFFRMLDKDTRWTWNNGLPTLITTLLQMNLNGYPFVLPDMIGGNGYTTEIPSKEIFIRWLQANVFMPSLQFSYVPWDFDNETIEISKHFTDLHAETAPRIIELMKKSVETGAPINPPIWWVDPLNTEAHKINDEFLLGEDILVAPVIEESAVTRDIYLPAGQWQDANYDQAFAGPIWLEQYPAPLKVLPYFYRV